MVHVGDICGIEGREIVDHGQIVAVLEHTGHVGHSGSVRRRGQRDFLYLVAVAEHIVHRRHIPEVKGAQVDFRQVITFEEHGVHAALTVSRSNVFRAKIRREGHAGQARTVLKHAGHAVGIVGPQRYIFSNKAHRLHVGQSLVGHVLVEQIRAVDRQVGLHRVRVPQYRAIRILLQIDVLREIALALADQRPVAQVLGHFGLIDEGRDAGQVQTFEEVIPLVPVDPRRAGGLDGDLGHCVDDGRGQAGGGGDFSQRAVRRLVPPGFFDGDDALLHAGVGHAEAGVILIEEAVGGAFPVGLFAIGGTGGDDARLARLLNGVVNGIAIPADGDFAVALDGHGVEGLVQLVMLGGGDLLQDVGAGLQATEVHRAAGLAGGGDVHGRAIVGGARQTELCPGQHAVVHRVHLQKAEIVLHLVLNGPGDLLVIRVLRRLCPALDEFYVVGLLIHRAIQRNGDLVVLVHGHPELAVGGHVAVSLHVFLQGIGAGLHILEGHAAQGVGGGIELDVVVVIALAAELEGGSGQGLCDRLSVHVAHLGELKVRPFAGLVGDLPQHRARSLAGDCDHFARQLGHFGIGVFVQIGQFLKARDLGGALIGDGHGQFGVAVQLIVLAAGFLPKGIGALFKAVEDQRAGGCGLAGLVHGGAVVGGARQMEGDALDGLFGLDIHLADAQIAHHAVGDLRLTLFDDLSIVHKRLALAGDGVVQIDVVVGLEVLVILVGLGVRGAGSVQIDVDRGRPAAVQHEFVAGLDRFVVRVDGLHGFRALAQVHRDGGHVHRGEIDAVGLLPEILSVNFRFEAGKILHGLAVFRKPAVHFIPVH